MPVANPPAPDVEAIARRITERLVVEGDVTSFPRLRAAIASALTAHTASLQARVEELERERDEARTEVQAWIEAGFAARLAAARAEAEANRMREALERIAERVGGQYLLPRINDAEAMCNLANAALRPADEPVTQREM